MSLPGIVAGASSRNPNAGLRRLRFLLVWPLLTTLRRKWRTNLAWRLGISNLLTVFLAATTMFVLLWVSALVYTFMLAPAETEPAQDAKVVANALAKSPAVSSPEAAEQTVNAALAGLVARTVHLDDSPSFNLAFSHPERLEHVRSLSILGSDGTILSSSNPSLIGQRADAISELAPVAFARAASGSTDLRRDSILERRGESAAVGAFPFPFLDGRVVVVDKSDLSNERGFELLLFALGQFASTLAFSILLISLPAAAVAAFIAIPLARTVVRPVRNLSDAVTGIAEGDLSRRAEANREDEVGALARSFNTMAADLQQTIGLEASERSRAEERTRELATLLEVSADVASSLELSQLFGTILDQVKNTVDYAAASILGYENGEFVLLESRGPTAELLRSGGASARFILADFGPIKDMLLRHEPVLIPDIQAEDELAKAYWKGVGQERAQIFNRARAWLAVPLVLNGRLTGLLALSSTVPGFFRQRDADFAMTIGNQAAVAMENARLFAEAERRAREMEALSRAAAVLSLEHTMAGTLNTLASCIVESTGAVACSVTLLDRQNLAVVTGEAGLAPGLVDGINQAIRDGAPTPTKGVLETQMPRLITGARAATLLRPEYARIHAQVAAANWQHLLIVPMLAGPRAIGTVEAYYAEGVVPDGREQALIIAMSAQAAVAVDNVRLFSDAELRAKEMETLSRIAATVNFDQPLGTILDRIAERVVSSTRARACSIGLVSEETRFTAVGSWGLPEGFMEMLAASVAAGTQTVGMRSFQSGKRIVATHLKETTPRTQEFASMRRFVDDAEWDSVVALPLSYRGRPLGAVQLYYVTNEEPDSHELTFVTALADQTAVALENARLFAQTERRVRELEAIAEISNNFTFAQTIDEMMVSLAQQVVGASSAMGCTVTLVDDDDPDQPVRTPAAFGFPDGFWGAMESARLAGAPSAAIEALGQRKTRLFHNVRTRQMADPQYSAARELAKDAAWDTLLAVPVVYRGVGLGLLTAAYAADQDPDADEISFLEAISDQAAIAIENSRLFQGASSLAALQERQRLARELHDSVSQALYGIALGARTARRRLESDPERVAEPLDYVLSLAEAGLTEMRALIFELRPESLAEEGLVAAISRQAAAMRARYGIDVTADLGNEPELELRVKETLYRIAQEALHNTVKHAAASHVVVTLAQHDGRVTLELSDDGAGFDPSADFPGHLGLRSMRERVASIGGEVTVASHSGEGTLVNAWVPATR